jgi:hypothetical protein
VAVAGEVGTGPVEELPVSPAGADRVKRPVQSSTLEGLQEALGALAATSFHFKLDLSELNLKVEVEVEVEVPSRPLSSSGASVETISDLRNKESLSARVGPKPPRGLVDTDYKPRTHETAIPERSGERKATDLTRHEPERQPSYRMGAFRPRWVVRPTQGAKT